MPCVPSALACIRLYCTCVLLSYVGDGKACNHYAAFSAAVGCNRSTRLEICLIV